MTASSDEQPTGISDEQLPDDLQPTDDNPLAQPLSEEDDPKSPDELDMQGGKTPVESDPDDTDEETGGDSTNGREPTDSDA